MQEIFAVIIVLVVILIILNGIARTPFRETHDHAMHDHEIPKADTSEIRNNPNYPTSEQKSIIGMLKENPEWYYFDEDIKNIKYLRFEPGAAIKFGIRDEDTKFEMEAKAWKWGPDSQKITIMLTGFEASIKKHERTITLTYLSDYLLELHEYEDSQLVKREKLNPV